MLAEISAEQLAEWMARDRIHPDRERRADLRAALIAWSVRDSMTMGGDRPEMETFLLRFGEDERPEWEDEDEGDETC